MLPVPGLPVPQVHPHPAAAPCHGSPGGPAPAAGDGAAPAAGQGSAPAWGRLCRARGAVRGEPAAEGRGQRGEGERGAGQRGSRERCHGACRPPETPARQEEQLLGASPPLAKHARPALGLWGIPASPSPLVRATSPPATAPLLPGAASPANSPSRLVLGPRDRNAGSSALREPMPLGTQVPSALAPLPLWPPQGLVFSPISEEQLQKEAAEALMVLRNTPKPAPAAAMPTFLPPCPTWPPFPGFPAPPCDASLLMASDPTQAQVLTGSRDRAAPAGLTPLRAALHRHTRTPAPQYRGSRLVSPGPPWCPPLVSNTQGSRASSGRAPRSSLRYPPDPPSAAHMLLPARATLGSPYPLLPLCPEVPFSPLPLPSTPIMMEVHVLPMLSPAPYGTAQLPPTDPAPPPGPTSQQGSSNPAPGESSSKAPGSPGAADPASAVPGHQDLHHPAPSTPPSVSLDLHQLGSISMPS